MRSAATPICLLLFAVPAAADSSAAIAAPGDCAQPIGEFATPLVYGQSAGVAGPPSDYFAPKGGDDLLPINVTRAPLVGAVVDTGAGLATPVMGTTTNNAPLPLLAPGSGDGPLGVPGGPGVATPDVGPVTKPVNDLTSQLGVRVP